MDTDTAPVVALFARTMALATPPSPEKLLVRVVEEAAPATVTATLQKVLAIRTVLLCRELSDPHVLLAAADAPKSMLLVALKHPKELPRTVTLTAPVAARL
jgi:hypothetical protein